MTTPRKVSHGRQQTTAIRRTGFGGRTIPRRHQRSPLLLSICAASVIVLALGWWVYRDPSQSPPSPASTSIPKSPKNLTDLLALAPAQVEKCDIALMNLLCADGLPGAEMLSADENLATLDQWTERIRSETERHLYKYHANPKEFGHSEAYFRMLLMASVAYADFTVRYNPARASAPSSAATADRFFADSKDIFLHGLCGGRRMGTCSSMPVLYVAIGRRLGYPLKLVTTKSHLFVRWDGPSERFNLEATGKGMNRYDDEHFKQWPFPVSEEEIQADGYLKSLTPVEELALFLSLRGHCLKEAGRLSEAVAAYAAAARWAPGSRAYSALLADAKAIIHQPSGRQVPNGPSPAAALSQAALRVPAYAGQPADPNPLLKLR